MQGEDRSNIKTQLIIVALKFDEFPDHIVIDYGVTLNQSMIWTDHVEVLSKKVYQRLVVIRRAKHLLPLKTTLVNSPILPLFYVVDFIWVDKDNTVLMDQLQVLHNKVARVVRDHHPLSSATAALSSLNWPTLSIRRHFHRCLIMLKCLNKAVDFDFNFQLNMLLMFIITTFEINKIYICNGPIGIGVNRMECFTK